MTQLPVPEKPVPETEVPETPAAHMPDPAPSGRRAARTLAGRRPSPLEDPTAKGAPASMDGRDGGRDGAPGSAWRRWLGISAALGAVMGVAWFVLAPGGAIYGDGADYSTWFPRDASLGALMLVAGVLSAVLLLRQGRKAPRTWASAAPTLAVLAGGLAGSVVAWRVGVFAGDLFHTVPDNLANPSIVFSLRSASVLLLWPLASAAVLFAVHFAAYYFVPPAPDLPEGPFEVPGGRPMSQPPAQHPAAYPAAHQPDA